MPVRVKVSKLYFVNEAGEKNAASVVFSQGDNHHPLSGYMNNPTGQYGAMFTFPGEGEVTVKRASEEGPEPVVYWATQPC